MKIGDKDLKLGRPYPLGSTLEADGVNFALFSANATNVELCLFDSPQSEAESRRIQIYHCTNQIWHVFVPGLKAGQLYGYRVHGSYEPSKGHRFNPAKLLLDPYAKAIAGDVKWGHEMFAYEIGNPEKDLSKDERNNAGSMPKSVVINPQFDWEQDISPNTPMGKTIIYETHVKGFSKLWNEMPENLRGTYSGIGSSESIEYFKKLGITAVELLPVHHRIDSQHLLEKNLSDYWGYNSIGFFAPDGRFSKNTATGGQVNEFKGMVKNLHKAGIEVILDVVYNHTSEGNRLGPMLCFRGIDNSEYYRLCPEDPRYYMDYTGTGNTLAVYQPNALQLVMDSLRYWITEMHVDGFRFDLAAALARELNDVNRLASFFDVIHQDPVISQVKLIAEPWDLGQDGYLVGKFPVLWSEWNGLYRDTVRKYWKGDPGMVPELARRISGSADLYEHSGRTPSASVNFITCHDGYTLADLVSYQETHNQANGEDNRDGEKNNNSWNCGAEGETQDPEINKIRRRQQRNFLATLFVSQGVPMLGGGDESGRTQKGNNNAYCQDNEISCLNWQKNGNAQALTTFVAKLIAFRKAHPIFQRLDFFRGRPVRKNGIHDITWLNVDGKRMSEADWAYPETRSFGVFLNGYLINADGEISEDDFYLICFNSHHQSVRFRFPAGVEVEWEKVLDTELEEGWISTPVKQKGECNLSGRSLVLFKLDLGNLKRAAIVESLVQSMDPEAKAVVPQFQK